MPFPRPLLLVAALFSVLAMLGACGGGSPARGGPSTTSSPSGTASGLLGGGEGEQQSSPASPPKATATKPTPSKSATAAAKVTERDADACPFVDTQQAVAAEGNRVSRITNLYTGSRLTGCRYYFWCCDFHATMEFTTAQYATPTAAYNAMVRTGKAGGEATGAPGIAPGVDGILYRTSFYQPDGPTDWACSFAAGRTVVTVKTDQNDTSRDALNLATLLAPHFTG